MSATAATFVLGARPVTDGYDSNIGARLASALFFPSRAPSGFSGCVLSCLESLEATTSGSSVLAVDFNESERQLILLGPASSDEIQAVLRSLVYTNNAPSINVAAILVEVGDIHNNCSRLGVV